MSGHILLPAGFIRVHFLTIGKFQHKKLNSENQLFADGNFAVVLRLEVDLLPFKVHLEDLALQDLDLPFQRLLQVRDPPRAELRVLEAEKGFEPMTKRKKIPPQVDISHFHS